jgi:hypothetical protein
MNSTTTLEEFMRLSGWQRWGILLSILWVIGAGVHQCNEDVEAADGYSSAVFVRLPQISVGSFNITLGEFSVPLLQKVPPGKFNCPMVNGKLTGDCKAQD